MLWGPTSYRLLHKIKSACRFCVTAYYAVGGERKTLYYIYKTKVQKNIYITDSFNIVTSNFNYINLDYI